MGALVVRNDVLVGQGANRPIGFADPTGHAEIIALRQAAQTLGNYRLPGCRLYVTLEPCLMCSGAIFHARLDEVIFGASDPKTVQPVVQSTSTRLKASIIRRLCEEASLRRHLQHF